MFASLLLVDHRPEPIPNVLDVDGEESRIFRYASSSRSFYLVFAVVHLPAVYGGVGGGGGGGGETVTGRIMLASVIHTRFATRRSIPISSVLP